MGCQTSCNCDTFELKSSEKDLEFWEATNSTKNTSMTTAFNTA